MGITVDEFFENIYGALFSTKSFYEKQDAKISVRVALGVVLLVGFISKFASAILEGSIINAYFSTSLFFHVFSIVIVWFLTALFFEYVAKIYSKNVGLAKILYFTAFAPLPYIFFAPLNLIKHVGTLGYVFASLTEFILYIWIIVLYAYALKASYEISLSRAFMVIFLPFVSAFFLIYWLVCIFTKISYIFSI